MNKKAKSILKPDKFSNAAMIKDLAHKVLQIILKYITD